MYDAIVVGARCAGASTAMLLARKGYRTLLVDRSEFPSDLPQGHFVHRHGPRLLHAWGLLDRVTATGCPAVSSVSYDFGPAKLTGTDLIANGVAMGYGPRRRALDKVLVDAAVEAGAELRTGFTVESFVSDGERITGVRARHGASNSMVTEHARIVIGADGRNSRLARTVKAPMFEATPSLTFLYFSYWSGVVNSGLEITALGKRTIFSFPTNDGLFAVFVAWPASELARVRTDVENEFLAAVDQVPDFAARVRSGRREERFYGAADVPNFY